ncbi:MAG: hypothetical protein B7Y41_02335 [Hydrogenophilales bacterium 28-61-23]|nr:MAG: hypothetical protein B7Y41_02335 [Hydrogenophilales bacterium 28-61-23]
MKTLSLIFLVAGLILAPAYWIYAKFYTGKQTVMLTLSKVASGEKPGDAADKAAAIKWISAPFELHPDMAPVGLILHADASFAPNMDESQPPQDRYHATLLKQGSAAKPLPFVLKAGSVANSNPVFKEHLLFFNAVQAGRYQMEISAAAEPRMAVRQMRLEVRQNLHEPDSRVVTGGIVLIVLALLGLIAL